VYRGPLFSSVTVKCPSLKKNFDSFAISKENIYFETNDQIRISGNIDWPRKPTRKADNSPAKRSSIKILRDLYAYAIIVAG